jgi:hypothetical protein
MNRPLISPSLLSANFANLQADIEQINRIVANRIELTPASRNDVRVAVKQSEM